MIGVTKRSFGGSTTKRGIGTHAEITAPTEVKNDSGGNDGYDPVWRFTYWVPDVLIFEFVHDTLGCA
jgi:hypothetical protein